MRVKKFKLAGDIGYEIAIPSLKGELAAVAPSTALEIDLNSAGGLVYDGRELYEYLRAWQGKVTIRVGTIAASTATLLLCAADEVVIGPKAAIMVHEPYHTGFSNIRLRDMQEIMPILEEWVGAFADTYVERSARAGKYVPRKVWLEYMGRETYFFGDEAVKVGLADRVDDRLVAKIVDVRSKFVTPRMQAERDLAAFLKLYADGEHPAEKPKQQSLRSIRREITVEAQRKMAARREAQKIHDEIRRKAEAKVAVEHLRKRFGLGAKANRNALVDHYRERFR